MKKLFALFLCLGLSVGLCAQDRKGGDIKKSMERSGDMQKDYEELMSLYNQLKLKAEAFQKKYNMLPMELMPIVMKHSGMGPGGGSGKEGKMMPSGGGQPRYEQDEFKPPRGGGAHEKESKPVQEKDIFE